MKGEKPKAGKDAGREPPRRQGRVKYLLIIIVIIGIVTYIFLGAPGPKEEEGPVPDRREQVWERIAYLEARRRAMLVEAQNNLLATGPSRSRLTSRGAYYAGYRDGFNQGYYEGSFLSANRKPDPLFFKVPNP